MKESKTDLFGILKRNFVRGVGLGAGLLTTGLLAGTAAMSIFSAGEIISADEMNRNFMIAAPEGAVIAFHLSECPEGWAIADGDNGTPDLRGRFIRGVDDAGSGAAGVDPDGVRAIGTIQLDAFQSHVHWRNSSHVTEAVLTGAGGVNVTWGGTGLLGAEQTGEPSTHGAFGGPRVAKETRPVNVALIYCMRKSQ